MKEIHQEVKRRLQKNTEKYKERIDRTMRDLQYKVGDMVMVHLKVERLPKGKYTKLMMRKMGPFKILQKCGTNSYKVESPLDIGLSNIFNVFDIYPYKGFSICDVGAIHEAKVPVGLPQKSPP